MRGCIESEKPDMIAEILQKIPRSDEDALPVSTLCPSFEKRNDACLSCILGILTILKAFDAILVSPIQPATEIRVKAKSEIAFYFLRSLARYIQKGMALTIDWERRGVVENASPSQVVSSGIQLVHAMEKIRTEEYGDLSPTRNVLVSQAIIKARVEGKREPMYLVQYDAPARQFQLIGGRQRKSDLDPLAAMRREISEELPHNKLTYPHDYELIELASALGLTRISPTFGAFSSYSFTVYQAIFKCQHLKLGPNDKWVSFSELVSGKTKDGVDTSSEVVRKVDGLLPHGLQGLRLSLESIQSLH